MCRFVLFIIFIYIKNTFDKSHSQVKVKSSTHPIRLNSESEPQMLIFGNLVNLQVILQSRLETGSRFIDKVFVEPSLHFIPSCERGF